MNPLETLIDQQAKLLVKMEQLMARDPSTEFARTEGSVGATQAFIPCPKAESKLIDTAKLASPYVVNSSIYPQFWRVISHIGYGAPTLINNARPCLRLEFDYSVEFNHPVLFLRVFVFAENVLSFTANTGDLQAKLDEIFPIRYRFLKITYGLLSGTGLFTGVNPSSQYGATYPLAVEIYGE